MSDEITNPWKVLKSETVYENPWIRVREDKVLNPCLLYTSDAADE